MQQKSGNNVNFPEHYVTFKTMYAYKFNILKKYPVREG